MRVVIFTLAVLLNCNLALTQEREFKINLPVRDPINQNLNTNQAEKLTSVAFVPKRRIDTEKAATFRPVDLRSTFVANQPAQRNAKTSDFDKALENTAKDPIAVQENVDFEFHWRSAMIQSGLFLGMQHAFRMTEKKTRDELDGPFFRDWKESVQNLHGWDDGGKTFTSYVAHPMQGALTARIFVNNSGRAKRAEFGLTKEYWQSRAKAVVWAAVWSTQFEIGPLSEASLGNVGQKLYKGHHSKMTYGDLVVTPVVGVMWSVGEDVIDKYILTKWIEKKVENRLLMKIFRSVLTPTTSFANIIRGRAPWRRDFRRN
ncbi:MAG TPA: hypothetical protein PLP21_13490 [Pyrinomonadaceae bacterium]|nr:hypothetical protein [Acidobacteriota bacterium]HQZ97330.1 hypothetical protein [Pyrinomonadaceae bacterium]